MNGPTHSQCFQALRIWELGKLRRVLCLRRRPYECWVDCMKRTGVIAARQLRKHNQPRVQTLAVRRVRTAAWQMVSCPTDAKGDRCWEESVHAALRRIMERRIHQIVQGGLSQQHAVETSSPRQTELLGASFHAFLGVTPGYRN